MSRALFFDEEVGANVVTVQDQRQGLLTAIGDRLTAAVLGDKLGDDSIDPICDCLADRSIPFLFLTGDSGKNVRKLTAAPILSRSFDGRVLIDDLVWLLVTGGGAPDLDDANHIDLIIFGAQTRLQRQERIVEELKRERRDLRDADGMLRIMRESLQLLQRHRRRLRAEADVRSTSATPRALACALDLIVALGLLAVRIVIEVLDVPLARLTGRRPR